MKESQAYTFTHSHQIFFETMYESLAKAERMTHEYIENTEPLLTDPTENYEEIITRTLMLGRHYMKACEMAEIYKVMAGKMLLKYVQHDNYDSLFHVLKDELPQHVVLLVSRCEKRKADSTDLVPAGVLADVCTAVTNNGKAILKETVDVAMRMVDALEQAEVTFASMDDEQLEKLLNDAFTEYDSTHLQELQDFIDEGEITTIKELKEDYAHLPLVKLYLTQKSNLAWMVQSMRREHYVMADLDSLCGYVMRYNYLREHGKKTTPGVVQINNPSKVVINTPNQDPTVIASKVTTDILKRAIDETLAAEDVKGNKIFYLKKQWAGIHVVLVSLKLYDGTDASFGPFLKQLGVNEPECGFPTKDFSRDSVKTSYDKWNPKDVKEKQKKIVADIFHAKLEEKIAE